VIVDLLARGIVQDRRAFHVTLGHAAGGGHARLHQRMHQLHVLDVERRHGIAAMGDDDVLAAHGVIHARGHEAPVGLRDQQPAEVFPQEPGKRVDAGIIAADHRRRRRPPVIEPHATRQRRPVG
jgi:hypothetical protein